MAHPSRIPTQMSDTTTHEVRVGAAAIFLPEVSDPKLGRYMFGYNIVILNQGDQPVQLLTRYWKIIDADGEVEEVQGEGVIGQTPVILPKQAFKYQSYCPLPTTWGTMEGKYTMRRENGEEFDAMVGRFLLKPSTPAPAETVVQATPDPDVHS